MTKVFMFINDISRYITSIPNLTRAMGEFGQLTLNDLPALSGQNDEGFWDSLNPASPLFGLADLTTLPIRIEQDGIDVFVGHLYNVTSDLRGRTAQITLQTPLQAALARGCVYVSVTAQNPALLFADMCDAFDIAYDSGAVAAASAIYEDIEVRVRAAFLNPDTTILDAFGQLTTIGVARIYSDNGMLFIEVWRGKTALPVFEFSSEHLASYGITLLGPPAVAPLTKESSNGYSVTWLGGTVQFGGTKGVRQISAGPDAPIRITTLVSATWIGENWLDYLNTIQNAITFEAETRFARELPLGAAITINNLKYNWQEFIADIVSIDPNDKLKSTIIAVTR